MGQQHHSRLLALLIQRPEDYDPYGTADRGNHQDCSCGCEHYYPLQDRGGEFLSYDWGICGNPRSHRCGLLTFEHQGCPHFTPARKEKEPEE